MRLEEIEVSEWGELLPETGFEPFHTPEALAVVRDHVPGELRLLAGFKGEETIGLFPVHDRSKLGGRLVTSPPLGLGIQRLGPVTMPVSPKQHKKEATNEAFIEAVLEAIGHGDRSTLVRLSCSPRYLDPRQFRWNGFDVTPAFTYRIDTSGRDREQLLRSFSQGLRSDIRKRDDVDVRLRRGGIDDVARTHEMLEDRYREQGFRNPVGREYLLDLFEALGDRARVYVAESASGAFLSGIIVLYSNDTAYYWKGGAKTDRTVSPNSLLHWRILEDVFTDPDLKPIEYYDLYTANNQRLTNYKSQFNGEPVAYYVAESAGVSMTAAKGLYRLIALGKHPLGE